MNRQVVIVTLVILLIGLVLLGLHDTNVAVADTSILDNEVAISAIKASNSSASATITITMYAVAYE